MGMAFLFLCEVTNLFLWMTRKVTAAAVTKLQIRSKPIDRLQKRSGTTDTVVKMRELNNHLASYHKTVEMETEVGKCWEHCRRCRLTEELIEPLSCACMDSFYQKHVVRAP